MELFFCSLCHESVPDAEVAAGDAVEVDSKVLCGLCCDLLSSVPGFTARVSGTASGSRLLFLGPLLVSLFALAGATLAWLENNRLHDEAVRELGSLQANLVLVQGQASRQNINLEESFLSARSLLEAQVESARQEASTLVELGRQVEIQLAAISSELSLLASTGESRDSRLGRLEGALSVLEDRAREHRSAQEMLRDSLAAMESRVRQQETAENQEADSLEDAFPPKIAVLLRQLQDEDPSARYDALESLVAFPDDRILPHLYPMLADPYEFSRFLAAHTFGEWEAKPAVPHLIEALMDEVSWVREATVVSLRRISGQNFSFDHAAKESDRRQGYERWKLWWDANETSFLRS